MPSLEADNICLLLESDKISADILNMHHQFLYQQLYVAAYIKLQILTE